MPSSQTQTVQIVVNGDPTSVAAGLNLVELLGVLGVDPHRVAIELNRAIVRQPDWLSTTVEQGAVIEVVQFVGGG
ncbi:MAG TPA: sulfur carrier protein ThiS [Bryobacteraceae bacterium]|nr:sulfur carrier protein ThiS [Bryobacteraceae bacterium]